MEGAPAPVVQGRAAESSSWSALTPGGAPRPLLPVRWPLGEAGGDRDASDARDARDGVRKEAEGGMSVDRSDWSPNMAPKAPASPSPPTPAERGASRASASATSAPEPAVRAVRDVIGRGTSPDTLSPSTSGPDCSVSPRLSGRSGAASAVHPLPREAGERKTPPGCRRPPLGSLSERGPVVVSRGHSDAGPGPPEAPWVLDGAVTPPAPPATRWRRCSNWGRWKMDRVRRSRGGEGGDWSAAAAGRGRARHIARGAGDCP